MLGKHFQLSTKMEYKILNICLQHLFYITAMIFSFLLKNRYLEANGKSIFFAMRHVAPVMALELNLAMVSQNALDAEVKAG